jgi:hypothetical protein
MYRLSVQIGTDWDLFKHPLGYMRRVRGCVSNCCSVLHFRYPNSRQYPNSQLLGP